MSKRRECLAVLFLVLGACADLPVSPQTKPLPRGPLTNSAEFGEGPTDPPKDWPVRVYKMEVHVATPDVNYPRRAGEIMGYMEYDAYHASMSAKSILREKDGTVIQRDHPTRYQHTEKYKSQTMLTQFELVMKSVCGGSLEGDVIFKAWWWGFNFEGTQQQFDLEEDSRSNRRSQDACEPCTSTGGGSQPVQYSVGDGSYDPYAEGPSDGEGCDGSSGGDGGGTGSGTQFGEGDSTGGETVDWGTGVGNGGSSECGDAAVVRWVCIDIYIDGVWQKYDCGWATTC